MPKIKLVKKKTNEMSGTGGSASATPGTGAQYAAPKAFPKVASDYNKTFGTHFAPSIPNRPSKAIDYKELWEAGEYDSLAGILKQLGAEEDAIKVFMVAVKYGYLKPSEAVAIMKKGLGVKEEIQEGLGNEVGDTVYFRGDIGEKYPASQGYYGVIEDIIPARNYNMMAIYQVVVHDKNGNEIRTVRGDWTNFTNKNSVKENTDEADFDSDTTGAEGLQSSNPLEPSTLKEARYTEFKKMTQVRTPGEQLHRAIREIRRKIDEINKLVSYTEKMKTEMKSDVSEVNYLKRTKEALAKISAKIQETNNKIKRLVQ